MERGVKASQPEYRELVEHSFGLMCMHDLDGVVEWVNPAMASLLGHEPSTMIGRNLAEFMADPDAVGTYLAKILEAGEDQG